MAVVKSDLLTSSGGESVDEELRQPWFSEIQKSISTGRTHLQTIPMIKSTK